MNELQLISLLTSNLPGNDTVVCGEGDDCAVLDLGLPGRFLLFKTDAVVEGVHFTADTDPEKIGYKALARCLSDIAAMGGEPGTALITLGLPDGFDPGRIEKIYRGLNQLARTWNVAIAGGETTRNPGGLLISVALIGTVDRARVVYRKGAQTGDAIFVSGELGGSIFGKHLEFEPRLKEAGWLTAKCDIHCMIDLSDGLAGDLKRILESSGKGAVIFSGAIPISRVLKTNRRNTGDSKPLVLSALTDGEDFELLFTVPARDAVTVLDGWKIAFPGLRLSCIGRIEENPGLRICDQHGVKTINANGYVHFQKP